MASKLVVDRQQATSAMQGALAAWIDELKPTLAERTEPLVEDGGRALDFDLLQKVLSGLVAASLERLVEADKAHLDELAEDVGHRAERDAEVVALRRKLIEIRRIFQGLFGARRSLEIVAIDGRTAEQPELLWRQGEHTLSRLREPDLVTPEMSTRAVSVDPSVLADELEPLVDALCESIHTVELDRRQAALTVEEKRAAMAEHDLLMGACGRIFSGLCLLARRPDLARRIRVTPPRRRSASRQVGAVEVTRSAPPSQRSAKTSAVPEPALIQVQSPNGEARHQSLDPSLTEGPQLESRAGRNDELRGFAGLAGRRLAVGDRGLDSS